MNAPNFKLTPAATTVIVVGVVAIAVYFLIFYKPKTKDEIDAAAISAAAEKDKEETIKKEEEKGVKASWEDFVYKQYADTLYEAMDGAGTDELAVSRVFEHILNKVDYIKLDQAYGVRDGYTMAQDLTSELNSTWLKQINGMLQRNGVGIKI